MKVKLSKVLADGYYAVREINTHVIAQYADAMKQGNIFPPIVLMKGTNQLICGYHRYTAYKMVFDPDYEIEVEYRKYSQESDAYIDAARDNAQHGSPLTIFEKKGIITRAKKYGIDMNKLSSIFGISKEKLEKWTYESVMVPDANGNLEEKPLKGGNGHLAGKEMTRETYDDMKNSYSGWNVTFHVNQIIKHINNGTIDYYDKAQNEKLYELSKLLETYIPKVMAIA